jgi:hypothetical protein
MVYIFVRKHFFDFIGVIIFKISLVKKFGPIFYEGGFDHEQNF